MNQEEEHFQSCYQFLLENIRFYEDKVKTGKKETEELYAAVQSGEIELYNQLIVSQDIQLHNENTLRKNKAAIDKPYFGRVDYKELESTKDESFYIGKNGITRDKTDIIIIDWRAPISTLYYENPLGKGTYEVPENDKIEVDLKLKRTFDMDKGKLLGYYDSDVASNDELLVKYLSKNKDVVLGDIIATIQKEQNEIIRERPFTNIIVQGVAGSGKTTVAMHRISYILYNYSKRFAPEEFCIIGSNDMLLSYITSGLPELDVQNVGQMRMDLFLCHLLGTDWKKKYRCILPRTNFAFRSKLDFILRLDRSLSKLAFESVPRTSIRDPKLGTILSSESIQSALSLEKNASVKQQFALLNERLNGRIRLLTDSEHRRQLRQEKLKQYRNYFKWKSGEKSVLDIYIDFLLSYELDQEEDIDELIADVQKGIMDVYDIAAMLLIQKRITAKKTSDDFGQLIIDEAQDFGVMVYYVLRNALPGCFFTIMGDVSQNINYATGMNSWDELRKQVFDPEKGRFCLLSKSYRNTIEISEYAGKVLDKASAGAYKIQPVIRHGMEVQLYQEMPQDMISRAVAIIETIKSHGYDTAAVICRTEEEAANVEQSLSSFIDMGRDEKDKSFKKGVMVLPIHLTKGLEFDTVILWNPNTEQYLKNEGDAKLLYVAITRALHELHILYSGSLSLLFED